MILFPNSCASRARAWRLLALTFAGFVASGVASEPEPLALDRATIERVTRVVAHRQIVAARELLPATGMPGALESPPAIGWSYQWGVVLYGALRSSALTGDAAVRDFVQQHNRRLAEYYVELAPHAAELTAEQRTQFVDNVARNPIARLMRSGDLDNTGAMGTAFLEAMLQDPARATAAEKAVVERVADWITLKQERLGDGTFWRPNLPDGNNVWRRDAVWADDLYMACPFLVRWAKYTGDARPRDDAARQIIAMASRLQDADGLWHHAWFELEKKRSPCKWGRANGWAMIATVEVLSELPDDHPARDALLDILRRHVAGVEQVQPPSGVWRQVLDQPDLWEETSCTAMFTYAIARAVRRGWISAMHLRTAEKAFAGLNRYISADGIVDGTCEGTNIGLTLDYYRDRRRIVDDLHSRGVVLLAGSELLEALNDRAMN